MQPLRYKVAISFDSREYYENFRPQGILCHEALPIQRTSEADLLSSDADQAPSLPEGIFFIEVRLLLTDDLCCFISCTAETLELSPCLFYKDAHIPPL